ncbi:MAG: GxxExxY protein [Thermoplasmatota archaeon]
MTRSADLADSTFTPPPADCLKAAVVGADVDEDSDAKRIIGAAQEVHRELGSGFLELAYARALELELGARGIPFEHEASIPLLYKGMSLGVPFRADFICGDLVVELKAVPMLGRMERVQVMHYLRCTGFRRGLLLNFGRENLQVERIEWAPGSREPAVAREGAPSQGSAEQADSLRLR